MSELHGSVQFPDRDTWLEARRYSLGASDAATAIGANPWSSPFALWSVKTGRVQGDDLHKSKTASEAMEWGLRLERAIGEAVADRTGRRVELQPDFCVHYHPHFGFLSCTLDALQWDDSFGPDPGVLQIKTTSTFAKSAWDEGTPTYYRIQLQQEMHCCGASWGSVVALVGGQRLIGPFDEVRSEVFDEAIVPELQEFWRCVENGIAPPADNTKATEQALRKFRVDDAGEPIVLPDEANEWAAQYRSIGREIKALEDQRREYKNKLLAELATNDARLGMLTHGGAVELRDQQRRSFTVDATTVRRLYFS